MLQGAEKIQPGAIILVTRRSGLVSWLIRTLLNFQYSHVAYYLGVGKILEADFGGVQINDISRYLDNPEYVGVVLTNPLPGEKIDAMTKSMLEHLNARYDYSLLFGNALTHLTLKCNRYFFTRWFDQARHWICSELIAEGFQDAGVLLPKVPRCHDS
jgi:hypothetical protein